MAATEHDQLWTRLMQANRHASRATAILIVLALALVVFDITQRDWISASASLVFAFVIAGVRLALRRAARDASAVEAPEGRL